MVTISADVTDSGTGVNYVQLFYRHSSAPTWTVAGNMTNTSGAAYEKEIGPFDTAGAWQYIIRAYDNNGNRKDIQQSFTVETCVADTTPPSVTNASAAPNPAQQSGCPSNTMVTISADVTDSGSGVNYVQLFYRHSSAPTWTVAGNMTNASGATYTKQIGPFGTQGTWQYIIRAYDNSGNRKDVQATFTVEGCSADTTPPSVTSPAAAPDPVPQSGCPGDTTVTISANVTDSGSGVNYVQLFYRHSAAPTWTVAGNMTNTSGDAYEKEIGPFSTLGIWKYIIRAYDNNGNRTDEQKSFTVATCGSGAPLSKDGAT